MTPEHRCHPRRTARRAAVGIAVLAVATVAGPWASAAADTIIFDGAGPGVARLGILGDSSLAGIRTQDALDPLARFNYTFDGEPCRRTTAASCIGRDGVAPESLITTMDRLTGQLGDVLVVMNGYNDPGTQFASAVDAVMADAAAQGIPKVVWLTMGTADVDAVGPDWASTSYTFRDNNRILLQKANEHAGALEVADWATYSADHPTWFEPDGITLTAAGAGRGDVHRRLGGRGARRHIDHPGAATGARRRLDPHPARRSWQPGRRRPERADPSRHAARRRGRRCLRRGDRGRRRDVPAVGRPAGHRRGRRRDARRARALPGRRSTPGPRRRCRRCRRRPSRAGRRRPRRQRCRRSPGGSSSAPATVARRWPPRSAPR